jgi:hypothetical protein
MLNNSARKVKHSHMLLQMKSDENQSPNYAIDPRPTMGASFTISAWHSNNAVRHDLCLGMLENYDSFSDSGSSGCADLVPKADVMALDGGGRVSLICSVVVGMCFVPRADSPQRGSSK